MTSRERQMICGLFLSKFDKDGLAYLGFSSFVEAFNAMGYALSARPASIKNYRDEFDPFFGNSRRGWHKRPLREHCRLILARFEHSPIDDVGALLQGFLLSDPSFDRIPDLSSIIATTEPDGSSPFARRLITGKAAERYFEDHYKTMPEFSGRTLTDTTSWGCGFDFKLSSSAQDDYFAVEVKGLRAKSGPIQLTDLEHRVSSHLAHRYFLVVVRNFEERPYHTVIGNPLHSPLTFTRIERTETRLLWTASV